MLNLRVRARCVEAEGVISLELIDADGAALPPFEAGAHVDLHIPEAPTAPGARNLVRQYSLCNDPAERHRYVVAVGRDAASRGGSTYLHDHLHEGDELQVGQPRNHFTLNEAASRTILVAGGIGITPLLAMARRLSALGRRWTLYYCVRTPQRAAFLAELLALPGDVIPVFDGVPGIALLDLQAVRAAANAGTHLYCCGPASLMGAFERAMAGRAPDTVHVEWFSPRAPEPAAVSPDSDHPFELHLARSGRMLQVPSDKSILDVLLEAGIAADYGCCGGVCGSCEVAVLDGRPLHRDSIFIGSDADVTDRILICVSRCAGKSLTLDL